MTVQIQFLTKPKFALGLKAQATATTAIPSVKFGSQDAVILNVKGSSGAQGDAPRKVGTSLFSGLTNELKRLTTGIQDITATLANTASGTAAYAVLEKQKAGLEDQFKNLTGQGQAGSGSAVTSILDYLSSLNNAFSGNGDASAILAQGNGIFGNDGVAFLQRGGADAARELATALSSLVTDGANLQDPSALQHVSDTVTRLDGLFSGDVLSLPAASSSKTVIAAGPKAQPIELQETTFESSGELALGLRSAAPDDLIRAAASGVDPHLVNSLVLKPSSDEKKDRAHRALADEQTLQLTQDSTAADSTPAV